MAKAQHQDRAGRYIAQPTGCQAFIPAPLPPRPPVRLSPRIQKLLSDADRALGRLDGVTTVLPNPELFVTMYVRQEAVLSCQIEGTQSTLEDLLEAEAGRARPNKSNDVLEVVNYVNAMNYGLGRLESLPLSLRFLREIHSRLLANARGGDRRPGEFRTSQNWIGGNTINEATFVPPPVHEMKAALDNLEKFFHDNSTLPVLVHCGLAHAQFETIHPFLDGNGRTGRLLITFLLCQRQILSKPLLYLSHYLKAFRAEYYDRLMAIRNAGDWEGWLEFFLGGVYQVSVKATDKARAILNLREGHRRLVAEKRAGHTNGHTLLDHLFQHPVLAIGDVERLLHCSYPTAASLVSFFEKHGLLQEITGQARNRMYRYAPYLELFKQLDFNPA